MTIFIGDAEDFFIFVNVIDMSKRIVIKDGNVTTGHISNLHIVTLFRDPN